jgi:hypothetical protein
VLSKPLADSFAVGRRQKEQAHFLLCYIEEIYVLRFPHAVSQSFPSVFPLLSVGTMATCEGCCHLTGAMLNLAAEAADRARIVVSLDLGW